MKDGNGQEETAVKSCGTCKIRVATHRGISHGTECSNTVRNHKQHLNSCAIGETGKRLRYRQHGHTQKHNRRQILATDKNSKYNKRRWSVPSKRAKGYADERRSKVHQHGPKEGRELTDYEAGIRSGYLQCQTDHAGMYKYKKALTEGKSKAEAKEYSQRRGK